MPYVEIKPTEETPFFNFMEEKYSILMKKKTNEALAKGRDKIRGYFSKEEQEDLNNGLYDAPFKLKTETLNPLFLEQSPYKLHVSINENDFLKHGDAIKNILINELEAATIVNFKMADFEIIKKQIENYNRLIEKLDDYIKLIKKNDEDYHKNPSLRDYKDMFGTRKFPDELQLLDEIKESWPVAASTLTMRDINEEELGDLISFYKQEILSAKRLIEGDQFTVYVPVNYEKEKLLILCKKINNFLQHNNAKNGSVNSDVESFVTPFINVRQEFLLSEYNSLEAEKPVNFYFRIDAVATSHFYVDQEEQANRRIQVVKEQEESDIFQYLAKNLTNEVTLEKGPGMFQAAKTVEKASLAGPEKGNEKNKEESKEKISNISNKPKQ